MVFRAFLLTFYILLSLQTQAANLCIDLFSEINVQDLITPKMSAKMKSLDYIIEDQKLYKTINLQKILVGNIQVSKPKYLFEWADQELHDYWKSNGKYTRQDMNFTLTQPAQATGRGYYVSTDPADSHTYGTHLTVFKIPKPLLLIEGLDYSFYEKETIYKELRDIGFSGSQGIRKSWISVFNEDVLADIQTLNSDLKSDMAELFPISMVTLETLKKIPANYLSDIINKLASKKIPTDSEYVMLGIYASQDSNKFMDQIRKLNKSDLVLNNLFANIKFDEINSSINSLNYENLNFVFASLQKNSALYGFLQLFDLFDIAMMGQHKMKERLTYDEMKAAAIEYAKAIETVDFSKIKNYEHFNTKIGKAFNLDLKIRNYDVVMSSYQDKDTLSIPLTQKTLNHLNNNSLLTTKKLHDFKDGYQNYTETEITYASTDNLLSLKKLMTESEIKNIQKLIGKDTEKNAEKATELMLQKVLEKMFQPKAFDELCALINEPTSARALYKVFVSLHPYGDGNGRAARLYYKWLVENHFKTDNSFVINLISDFDIFEDPKITNNDVFRSWLATRSWVLSARDETTMIERARFVFKNDHAHAIRLNELLDLKELLNEK